jgi:hypothetical protein
MVIPKNAHLMTFSSLRLSSSSKALQFWTISSIHCGQVLRQARQSVLSQRSHEASPLRNYPDLYLSVARSHDFYRSALRTLKQCILTKPFVCLVMMLMFLEWSIALGVSSLEWQFVRAH